MMISHIGFEQVRFEHVINVMGWALIHFVWQGALIGVVTAILLTMLRHATPQSRYLAACCALLLCLSFPVVYIVNNLAVGSALLSNTALISANNANANNAYLVVQAQTWLQSHMHWFVLWWSLAVALLSLRMGLGLLWLRGYHTGKRGSENPFWQSRLDRICQQFSLQKKVLLRLVDDIDSPVTIGFFRPMVLIPASLLTGMSTDLLEALIAHEVAHISRFDYAINLLQNLIEMLLFFHPAVWWISKKIRSERENIADDLAARNLGEPRRLALALQELDRFQLLTPQLVIAAHGGNLMLRIKRLIRPEVTGSHWKTAVIVFVFSGLFFCALFYSFGAPKTASQLVPSIEKTTMNGTTMASNNSTNSNNVDADLKNGTIPARIEFEKEGCRPDYPRNSLRNEETGMTTLKVTTSINGAVSKVDIMKSSGFRGLDNAVVEKLLAGKCINKPGLVNGQPAETETLVQYLWKLD